MSAWSDGHHVGSNVAATCSDVAMAEVSLINDEVVVPVALSIASVAFTALILSSGVMGFEPKLGRILENIPLPDPPLVLICLRDVDRPPVLTTKEVGSSHLSC